MKKVFALILSFSIVSCIYQNESFDPELESSEFSFPETFDFTTDKTIKVEVSGLLPEEPIGIIDVYINGEKPVHIGKFNAAGTAQYFRLPYIENELLLIYRNGVRSEFTTADISNSFTVSWDLSRTTQTSNGRSEATEVCIDRLYAVENSFGGFWEIDVTNSEYTDTALPNLQGGGSITCALDQSTGLMYYNVNRTLYAYDIEAGTFTTIHSSNPYNGSYPRLAYRNGLFYMSKGSTLFVVDAASNEIVNQYSIQGYVNSNGDGDVDFTSDGTLYLSCF